MKMALMVKRVEQKDDKTYLSKGDAVTNLDFSQNGIIFSWGDGDRFEISFEDFFMLQDVVRNMAQRVEKERYMKNQSANIGSPLRPY